MGLDIKEYENYLTECRSFVLATVGTDNQPNLRHIGGYNLDGVDILFGTNKASQKVKEIDFNTKVTALFQKENQEGLRNFTVYGIIQKVEAGDIEKSVEIIKKRRPQFNYKAEESIIYRIKPQKIKKLNFSAEEKTKEYTKGEF